MNLVTQEQSFVKNTIGTIFLAARGIENGIYCVKVKNEEGDSECAVCLQPYIHPAKLPCGHIFCFLCVKGVAFQNRRCAMCRQNIPSDYLNNPVLLNETDIPAESNTETTEGFQWFYEGRNGWWKYDERSSVDLEDAWSGGSRHCELLLAGTLYIVDFDAMLQLRKNDPSRRRRIKRDASSIQAKGIAGIKSLSAILQEQEAQGSRSQVKTPELSSNQDALASPHLASPQLASSPPRDPSLDSAILQLRSLSLRSSTPINIEEIAQQGSDQDSV